MVFVDRWLIVGILGFAAALMFAAGEFLGWWDQLGEFGFWFSLAVGLAGFIFNATRGQGKLILEGLRDLRGSSGRVETGIGRVETGIGRIETGIGRIEGNTAETVQLLREIRDRLPAPR